jgi:hypothetical protein
MTASIDNFRIADCDLADRLTDAEHLRFVERQGQPLRRQHRTLWRDRDWRLPGLRHGSGGSKDRQGKSGGDNELAKHVPSSPKNVRV